MSPEEVIDLQIEAFNRGDADAFAALYAVDAVITNALSQDASIRGRNAIREHQAAMFLALPDGRASVTGRLVVDKLVTDQEHLPSLEAHAVAIYEVEAGLIRRAWLFGPLLG